MLRFGRWRDKQTEKSLNIKTFFNWILTSLRDLLALQELKQTGKNAELVARAFGTYELKAPKKFSQEEIDKKLKEEYKLRLIETLDKHQPQEDKCPLRSRFGIEVITSSFVDLFPPQFR